MKEKIAEPICDYLCHGEGEKPCAKYGTALCHLDNAIKKQLALIAEDRAGLVEALKMARCYVESTIEVTDGTIRNLAIGHLAVIDAAIEGRK